MKQLNLNKELKRYSYHELQISINKFSLFKIKNDNEMSQLLDKYCWIYKHFNVLIEIEVDSSKCNQRCWNIYRIHSITDWGGIVFYEVNWYDYIYYSVQCQKYGGLVSFYIPIVIFGYLNLLFQIVFLVYLILKFSLTFFLRFYDFYFYLIVVILVWGCF